MKYPQNTTISYPFTAYYHGYLADLGANPSLNVNIYSAAENQLIPTTVTVDLKESSQVYDDVLLVGTIYISQADNSLEIGNYFLNLSIQTPSTNITLLYAPLDIVDNSTRIRVSPSPGSLITDDEMRYHIRNIIPAGVKHGFRFLDNPENLHYSLTRGIAYTEEGYKIETTEIHNAFNISPSSLERVDAVCLYYNPKHIDSNGRTPLPRFRVLKGIEDGNSIPPTIPPFHTVIKYALVPAGALYSKDIIFFEPIRLAGRRPFYNIPSQETADGSRSIFTFSNKFVEGTTESKVDGVPQYRDMDYIETETAIGYTAIDFIDGVPKAGQKVVLSGLKDTGPYYDHDYSPYNDPSATPPVSTPYSRSGLEIELLGHNYVSGTWQDTANLLNPFSYIDEIPLKGWDGVRGEYVYFSEGTEALKCDNASTTISDSFTIAIKADFSELSQSQNWMRLLTKGDDLKVFFINSSTPSFIVDYFGTRTILDIQRWKVDQGIALLSITFDASGAPSGNLKLSFNSDSIENSINVGTFTSSDWVIGNEDPPQTNKGLHGRLMAILFYNRVLSELELSDI